MVRRFCLREYLKVFRLIGSIPKADPKREESPAVVVHNFSQVFTGDLSRRDDKPPPIEEWLTRSPALFPLKTGEIPRIINKMYFQKQGGYSVDHINIAAAHKSWQEMNPGYNVRYFDLNLARQYLREHFHPVFLRAFDCIQAFAMKSDLFRMALLYREGECNLYMGGEQCLTSSHKMS